MATQSEMVDAKLSAHEILCAERYRGINARLKRIELGLIGSGVALIGAMGWAINLLIGLVAKL
jgi:hypothetical protein